VEPGYIRDVRQAGYKDMSVADLTQLASYHVSPELLKGLKAQGYDLQVKDVVQLGSYGVSGDYMADLKKAGLEKLPVKDIVQLRSYGVPAQYIADTRSLGYKFSIDEIVRLHYVRRQRIGTAPPARLRQKGPDGGRDIEAADAIAQKQRLHHSATKPQPKPLTAETAGAQKIRQEKQKQGLDFRTKIVASREDSDG